MALPPPQLKEPNMAKVNGLDKMSLADLQDLRVRVDAAIAAAEVSEKKALREEMEQLAASRGLSIADIFGGKPAGNKLKGSKVAVKYRNPKNPDETWTGRGRKPNWLADALKKGQKIESFMI